MDKPPYVLQQSVSGLLLVLSAVLVLIGVSLWTGRNLWNWSISKGTGYLLWERGFVLAAIVVVVLGLALLEGALSARGEVIAARLGLVTYLIAATLGIAAETYYISGREPLYALIVVYVVMALLGQSAFGVSLLNTGLLPAWIGWSTIVWNLAFLVLLFAFSSADVYYPVVHHAMPLLIGVALLLKR